MEGKFKKASYEVASYAKEIAGMMGTTVTAITFNANDVAELGTYGVDKVLKVSSDKLKNFNAEAYADAIKQAAEKEGTKVVVVSQSAHYEVSIPCHLPVSNKRLPLLEYRPFLLSFPSSQVLLILYLQKLLPLHQQ